MLQKRTPKLIAKASRVRARVTAVLGQEIESGARELANKQSAAKSRYLHWHDFALIGGDELDI